MSSHTSGPFVRAGGTAGQRCAAAGSVASATVPAVAPAINVRRVILSPQGSCVGSMFLSRAASLCRIELHHLDRGAADDAIGMADGLAHLIVVVAPGDDEFDRLAGGRERCRKVARLALDFRRLRGADAEGDRSVNPVEVAL